MSDLAGKTIGGYPIERSVGVQGYVELLEARTSAAPLNIRILREELRGDSELLSHVLKSWDAVRVVQHANLRVVYSVGNEASVGVFGLEEPISGSPLRESILSGAKVAWRDCAIIAEQLFKALQALHKAGFVHGCVWTGDILMTQDQDLKLSGAGMLSKLERQLLQVVPGPAAGYLAPETLSGSPPTVENDIYGAGACLYFILSGRDPFPGEDAEMIREQALTKRPPPISAIREEITPLVENFITRLMAKDPTQRYGSVEAVLADIENVKNNKPLNVLSPGKPAPPPRPLPGTREKVRSGVQGTVGAERGTSAAGMRPAKPSGASTGTLQAIKGQTGKVFGRLETHVKSTIPQSDTERKGDDYHRQGQLPLALSNWREAFENEVPHAALKIKIELAERELKREAFSSALEEAKLRMNISDYRAAVSRAREALLAAENEAQRQEAMQIETEAGRRAEDARRAANTKLIVATVVVIAALILIFILIRPPASTGDTVEDEETPVKTAKGKGAKDGQINIPAAGASIMRPPGWTGDGASLRYDAGNDRFITMQFARLGKSTSLEQKREELKSGKSVANGSVVSALDAFAFLDEGFACSEIAIRFERDGTPHLRFSYLIQGPDEAVFQVDFEGQESAFDLGLQGQVRGIIQSWTYARK